MRQERCNVEAVYMEGIPEGKILDVKNWLLDYVGVSLFFIFI